MKYQIRTSALTVAPVFSDMSTHVKIEDGGVGEFVSVEQNRTDYRASINPEEWEALQIAITDMIGRCRK